RLTARTVKRTPQVRDPTRPGAPPRPGTPAGTADVTSTRGLLPRDPSPQAVRCPQERGNFSGWWAAALGKPLATSAGLVPPGPRHTLSCVAPQRARLALGSLRRT